MGTPPPIELANLGMADSLILMVMALVVFGPRRLPQIGRQIGKLMYEFRKASNDFKFQMEEELRLSEEADRQKKEEAERQRVAALAAANPSPAETQAALPAQTVEAQADVGAAESSIGAGTTGERTYPEQYPPEAGIARDEAETTELRIQPPQTGEQISAAAPFSAGTSELNADADVDANAATLEAQTAVAEVALQAAPEHVEEAVDASLPAVGTKLESSTPPKEPVSQHG